MAVTKALLHSLVPGHGIWSTLLEIGVFVTLVLAILGAVVVGEDSLEGRERWSWLAIVLLVPIAGTITYLVRRRHR